MIFASQEEEQLKGSACKFSDFKFEVPIINIIYWGHWTSPLGKEELDMVTPLSEKDSSHLL